MGGRGRGGGGGGSNTVRSVANALGIARHDVQRMMQQQKIDPPPLYPKVKRDPIPLEMSTDLVYISRLKMEMDQRMRDSEFFIEAEKDEEIKRYLDKYSVVEREKLEFDFSCLPAELNWKKKKNEKVGKDPEAKRRKVAGDDDEIKKKLEKLEAKEGTGVEDDDEEKHVGGENENDEENGSEKSGGPEDAENVLSDDDYQEEDNDYISNYFDNGEGYGDGGSGDNMDGDEY